MTHSRREDPSPVSLIPRRILCFVLLLYKKGISPFMIPCCRYQPTCSEYAFEAISKYGVLKGCWLSVRRLLRCHPFHAGGWDPVP